MLYHFKSIEKSANYIAISLICLAIFSCSSKEYINSESSLKYASTTFSENTEGNSGSLKDASPDDASLNSYNNDDISNKLTSSESSIASAYKGDYVIGPEDLIEISVYQGNELNQTARVSSSGFIKLPLVGTVKVSGLTAPELENQIGERLQKYFQEPVVSIFIKEYRSQSITVLGAVLTPQVYTVTRQKFLIDMLSISGGITKDAGDICYVRRGNETIIINIKELLIGGNMRLNIPVFSGDIIHVPIGGIIFVDGSVNSPGSFNMQGTITLTQAIAMAKGLKYEAIRDEIKVYRDTGKDTRDIIDIDYDAILERKSPDIFLKDKDVLIIPKSGVKGFLQGFVQSLTGAFRFGSSVSVGAGM